MKNENFFQLIAGGLAARREKSFLATPDNRVWTFGDIDALSAKIARALVDAGARPGDRVAAQVEKSAENVALYLAALRAGLVYLPLNTAYTPQEIDYFIKDAEPAIFVCDPARAENAASGPATFTLSSQGAGTLIDAARRAPPLYDIEPRYADDLAAILYTSGTTGRSKGAMLTHRNLSSNALALIDAWKIESCDVLLHALPIFHIHGLFVALNTALIKTCSIIFLPKFDVGAVRRALPGATLMMGVPTFYARLLAENDFSADECAGVRLFISGSAPLTAETHRAFEKRTGFKILERYGMSEAGMIASNPLAGDRVAGTVGYALAGVELRVCANGAPLAPGETGIVEVRGANVFKGYWRMPEKTAREFRGGGWFSTGDVGFLSEDGRLTLSGRAKDLIIVGGMNVYPKEIEDILGALPGIAECAVIGAAHADMGEGVVAVLVPAPARASDPPPDEAALRDALAGLARFKQPRRFYWLDALPRNAMGKVQKQVLRDMYADAFA
ncbi:MAG: AMP-binding protein [Parvularculaceae bacterium]|nr:AMP-binding protein [Parvularculaceae bacterium]